jgi:beta-lactam-binding protein with PASTA domain
LGKEAYEIPDLCGYSCADAKIALRKLGATVRIVYVYDELADPDRVMRISPAAGKSIEPYDKVTIFVSRDQVEKPVKVRDFCGMTKESACLRILADGLLVGKIAEEYRENGEVGTVISQSIAKGCYVKKGSEIDITVISQKTIEDAHPFGRYITEENGEINGSED